MKSLRLLLRALILTSLTVTAACDSCGDRPVDGGTDAGVHDGGTTIDENGFEWPFRWPVPTREIEISPSARWKTRLSPDDPFVASGASPGGIRWAKVTVLMEDPDPVYFQDNVALPFHYDFATQYLDPWIGISRQDFDAIALHAEGQALILGAVVFPPRDGQGAPLHPEVGIQLVRQEPFHPGMALALLEMVKAALDLPEATDVLYFPTFEQERVAVLYADYFAEHGFNLGSPERWLSGDACYVDGWALGRVVDVGGSDIANAYREGRLSPADILVTDAVPAEIPYVAGILARSPSTPNSHVALLAESYGVPFAYARDDDTRAAVDALVGRDVALRVETDLQGRCAVRLIDVTDLDPSVREDILSLKEPPPITIRAKESAGVAAMDLDDATVTDLPLIGGKAAHYTLLRDSVPARSRPAIALTFDVWDAFMAQPFEGSTLGARINERLSAHAWPPVVDALLADLAIIRQQVRAADVPSSVAGSVIDALAPFDASRKIRFRSSTNVEDSETFSGAGLYDSYSGCLLDDTDADEVGPSHCDDDEQDERGVLRAMKRVFASFYNDNAYLERLRRGIDENDVGMAVLVHHSFPDDEELANGVATVEARGGSLFMKLVTQKGAVSVTNPDTAARPEVVEIYYGSGGASPSLVDSSSLVPLGDTVLDWPDDYAGFADLFATVLARYEAVTGRARPFVLDFEYKKTAPEGLMLKQVRPVPLAVEVSQPTFLLDEPLSLCVLEGEAGDVLGNHRGKLVWTPEARAGRLDDEAFAAGLIAGGELRLHDGSGGMLSYSGAPAAWPDGGAAVVDDVLTVSFSAPGRVFSLSAELPRELSSEHSPLLTLRDLFFVGTLTYNPPAPSVGLAGEITAVTSDLILLEPCREGSPPEGSIAREEVFESGGVTITTRFVHPPDPGIAGGYTAPLFAFEETVIEGLVEVPLVLTDPFAQTYRPGHHNFEEYFAFEPRLDPALSVETEALLDAADVALIWVWSGYQEPVFRVQGLDGAFREIP